MQLEDAIRKFVADSPIFRHLPDEAHRFITSQAKLRHYQVGEILGHEGSSCGFMFGVVSGRLRNVKFAPEGRRIVFTMMEPGSWAGFYWAVEDGVAVMDVEAIEPTCCVQVSRSAMYEAGRRWPKLYENLYFELVRVTRHLFPWIELQLAHPLRVRVARVLLGLLHVHHKQLEGGTQLTLPISQSELADLAFCSRQHLNKVFNEWSGKGAISLAGPKQIVFHDVNAIMKDAALTPADLQQIASGDRARAMSQDTPPA